MPWSGLRPKYRAEINVTPRWWCRDGHPVTYTTMPDLSSLFPVGRYPTTDNYSWSWSVNWRPVPVQCRISNASVGTGLYVKLHSHMRHQVTECQAVHSSAL